MRIDIDVTDELTPAAQYFLANSEVALRRISKSVGWWAQKNIKQGIRSGHPDGQQYESRLPYGIRRDLAGKAPRAWYGKLANAFGYEYKGNGIISIGWTSRTAAFYGKVQEFGTTRRVTQSVRNFWAAHGHPLSKNVNELNVPARPIFEPMANVLRKDIASFVEEKVKNYTETTLAYGKKSPRKYKVYHL